MPLQWLRVAPLSCALLAFLCLAGCSTPAPVARLAGGGAADHERAVLRRSVARTPAVEPTGNPPPPPSPSAKALERSARTASVTGLTKADQADCGPRALLLVLRELGVSSSTGELRRLAGTTRYGTTLAGLDKAVREKGLRTEAVQMDLDALKRMEGMGISRIDGDHYVEVVSVSGDEARIHDPNHAEEETIPTETLLRRSGGIVMKISRP